MEKNEKAKASADRNRRHEVSAEAQSYLRGLFEELALQTEKYQMLTHQLLSLEARVELAEKTVCLTRDHLALAIERLDSTAPRDWSITLNQFRFAGVRLADACMALLSEGKKMTPQELLIGLNKGMFRFRTSAPLREIHAALLRQNFAKKEDQYWIWSGADAEDSSLRARIAAQVALREASSSEEETE